MSAYEISKRTLDDYKCEIKKLNENIEILNSDENIKTSEKLYLKCSICNHEFTNTWGNISKRRKVECYKCKIKNFFESNIKNFNENIKIISETYVNSRTPIDCECKICGFKFSRTWDSLKNIKTCPNCKELENKNKKYSIIESEFYKLENNMDIVNIFSKNNRTCLELKCKICDNEWVQKWVYIKNGIGCAKCANNKTLTLQEFIEKSSIVHNHKYDYSLVNYKGNKEKVIIICPIHGEFEQLAGGHLSGKGCIKCTNVGWYNSTLSERNKEIWLNEYTNIYLFKLVNEDEEFFKIGIAKNIKNRANDIKAYKCELLYSLSIDRYNASYLEKELHKNFYEHSYRPKIKFDGYTECFSEIDMDKFKNIVNSYDIKVGDSHES